MCIIKHHNLKTYGAVEVLLHAFLFLALEGGECSASYHNHLHSGKRASTFISCWHAIATGPYSKTLIKSTLISYFCSDHFSVILSYTCKRFHFSRNHPSLLCFVFQPSQLLQICRPKICVNCSP